MQCRRTANAGVLLTLDGITVLLDGVCRQSGAYYGTPEEEIQSLLACPPDITAFTHGHLDHFDRSFAQKLYHKTLRPVLGPEGLLKVGSICEPVQAGTVTVTPIPSRHIGVAGKDTPHVSFLVQGSKRILFTGDASPVALKDMRADVLIAPYAYATTPGSWQIASQIAPELILLHLPMPEQDPAELWRMVKETAKKPGANLTIPEMSQIVRI